MSKSITTFQAMWLSFLIFFANTTIASFDSKKNDLFMTVFRNYFLEIQGSDGVGNMF